MIHPCTRLVYINDTVGYGVFATDFIPEGTITYVKDSLELEISPTDLLMHSAEMQQTIEKYSYIDQRGYRIVSWDFAKYVNHCCHCNTISTGYGFEIAIRDIQAGEQLTDEYGIFNLNEELAVVCGERGCRKVIRNEDFDRYYREWDEKIKQSIQKLFSVEQPLITLVDEATRRELDQYFMHPQAYKSVYALRLLPENGQTVSSESENPLELSQVG